MGKELVEKENKLVSEKLEFTLSERSINIPIFQGKIKYINNSYFENEKITIFLEGVECNWTIMELMEQATDTKIKEKTDTGKAIVDFFLNPKVNFLKSVKQEIEINNEEVRKQKIVIERLDSLIRYHDKYNLSDKQKDYIESLSGDLDKILVSLEEKSKYLNWKYRTIKNFLLIDNEDALIDFLEQKETKDKKIKKEGK